ncbi:MAG: hypothetical protein K6G51_03970 [Sphaerochaetaceae bacterium]|nr:hypothetical protein [Sphaerochaetaceae bacterium]
MTIFLLIAFISISVHAIAISMEACFTLSPTIITPTNIDNINDKSFTAGRARIDIAPLKIKLWRFSVSPYGSITKQSDSLVNNGITLLGFDIFCLGIQADYNLSKRFDLGLSFGAGKGKYNFNKTVFALYESTLFVNYLIKPPFSLKTGINYSVRDGATDFSTFIGIKAVYGGRK